MINFLNKITATEELRNSLKDGSLKAMLEKGTTNVRVTLSNVTHLSPTLYLELFKKTKETVSNEMNGKLVFIKIEIEHKNDLIHTYESTREFINWIMPNFNLSNLHLSIGERGEFVFSFAKDESLEAFNTIKEELEKYLRDFGISNRELRFEVNTHLFSTHKLNDLIEKSAPKTVIEKEDNEIHDEKVKDGYKEIDFDSNEDKQTRVYFNGQVMNYEKKTAKTGTILHNFYLAAGEHAIMVTVFDKENSLSSLKDGTMIRVYGNYEKDDYREMHVMKSFNPTTDIQKISEESILNIEKDETGYSRSEFHVHTKMSTLDGVSTVKDYIKYAEAYNLNSITITDHNTAQAYPEAYFASLGTDVTVNYGVELDVYDDLNTKVVINPREQEILDAEYIFFDLETTSVSALFGEIIEFGAVRYKNNKVIERKQIFIKPDSPISEFTTSLTSITNEDVANAPKISEAIVEIRDWIGDAILVAHNASFDFNFLNKAYIENGFDPIENPVIDSMKLSWHFHPTSRAHRLGALCKNEGVFYDEQAAHRADYDAEVLSKVFERLIHKMVRSNIRNLIDLNPLMDSLTNYIFTNHITLISKNQKGLRDINEIISMANVNYFNDKKKLAMIPLSFFINKNEPLLENILVGSSCSKGVLFESILNADWPLVESIIGMYDYIEIFPPSAYKHLVNTNTITSSELKKILRKIKEIADKHEVPVIISSNAHYSSKQEKIFRDILISAKRVGGGGHPLNNFRNPKLEKPDNHLRSTKEILEDFKGYFEEDEVIKMAVTNTTNLQSKISSQKPIKDELYAPKLPEAESELTKSINDTLKEYYGENPDKEITDRLERELSPIIEHGFSIIYYLSAIAVKKSNDDGYLVGSRGSVGSSIAATFSGITEVNPLRPHYRCPNCKHHEFNSEVDCGYDLPTKECPVCKTKMIGDGHKIPFETFLGFNADKVPDIDLNFSRENQSKIHLYMKEVLGEENVFRAGTISTAAPKTAIGYVKNYEEMMEKHFDKPTIEWFASKVEGAKRTTGQHPGGLIVIPREMSVYDFTPINYPGDDSEADWKTTHFDFHSIHDNLLKLDLLGHLDPSSVRMLQTLTEVDPKDIPMNDKQVISLFESNEALNYTQNFTGEELGILGLPEFGTKFVRDLVREAKPKSFADLVRISGLSHGTDVWAGNAQTLIKNEIATLAEVISVRDDIMTYLIEKGLDNSMSFDIMESVRKGKGLMPEWEHSMRENNVPDWYIESCKAIKYMFPKAHATAYVMMAYRIAWYKINYPLQYYATYFSKRDVEIDLERVLKGVSEMNKHIKELNEIPYREKLKKHNDLLETYNIILEMYSRGYEFENVNIHKSRSENYEINWETGKLIPPFSVLDGIGSLVAKGATKRRNEKPFDSIIDFKNRSGFPNKIINRMIDLGIFKDEEKHKTTTQQLSLFD